MVKRKQKDNPLAVRPNQTKAEITTRRPVDLWSEMDRMFENFRSNFDDLFWPWGQHSQPLTSMTNRTPPLDIADLGDHYEMHLEMPGIPKDNINIEVTQNTIEVSAHYKEDTEEKDKNWLRRERSSSSFYRALELPEELKTNNVDAEFKDGILTIKLPKVEPKPEHKPTKVKIK